MASRSIGDPISTLTTRINLLTTDDRRASLISSAQLAALRALLILSAGAQR